MTLTLAVARTAITWTAQRISLIGTTEDRTQVTAPTYMSHATEMVKFVKMFGVDVFMKVVHFISDT